MQQTMRTSLRGAALPARRAGRSRAARAAPLAARAGSALILNTKGGGHAFIGLYLAKELLAAGHSVTILNDGDRAKLEKKGPCSQYAALGERATVLYGDPASAAALPGGPFDVVYDNNGKSLDTCGPAIDFYKGKVGNYVFVGSAGAYLPNALAPQHVEGDARKASASHVAVENYLAEQGLPFTVAHPLYLYGAHTAKDCEQWFMDRVVRDRFVPIPAPGIQLTSLTHVEDVATLLAAIPGRAAALGQHFNACSDRPLAFDGIVQAVADAAGREARIVHYAPAELKLGKGEGFPFRAGHFFASCDKAKRLLEWAPRHTFGGDVADRLAEYVASGRAEREIDFSTDDTILAHCGGANCEFVHVGAGKY